MLVGTAQVSADTGSRMLDALAERVRIENVRLSPDGRTVAFLTARHRPREDKIECALRILEIARPQQPIALVTNLLPSQRQSEVTVPAASQFRWSADSQRLLYTTGTRRMELRLWNRTTGKSSAALARHDRIQIDADAADGDSVSLSTFDAAPEERLPATSVPDRSLQVQDEQRFLGPFDNPKLHPPVRSQSWKFHWKDLSLHQEERVARASSLDYLAVDPPPPFEMTADGNGYFWTDTSYLSPDGRHRARLRRGRSGIRSPEESRAVDELTIETTEQGDPPRASLSGEIIRHFLTWSRDSREIFFIERGRTATALLGLNLSGTLRTVYEENALILPAPAFATPSGTSSQAGVAVLVRSTNLTPDELIAIDLTSGTATVLYAPNGAFPGRQIAEARYVSIDGGHYDGRLFLPKQDAGTSPYPLVFTLYVSNPGFATSVGDEVPIHALVEKGIAVLSLNCRRFTASSLHMDYRFELVRVDRPRLAMEQLIGQFAAENLIDATRVGVAGLSYGSEIAMHAYWNSKHFRAVSSSETSWNPSIFALGGITFARNLERRGFKDPANDRDYAQWSLKTPGLHARPDLPPLLIQSSEGERYINVENWFRLRRAGAQVEWYEYPNEGHIKEGPANKWWVYSRNFDWFRFWLQDAEDPSPDKSAQYTRWRDMRRKWQEANRETAERQAAASGS